MKTIANLLLSIFTLCGNMAAQTPGAALFDDSFVHEIRLTSYFPNLWDTLTTNYLFSYNFNQQQIRDIPYAPAAIAIDGVVRDSVGLRHKGFNSWWSSSKKPLKVDLNQYISGQKFDKEKKFNLHNGASDPTMLRDNLCYRILRELGIKAPRTAFAAVYLDDQYMGLYRLVEQVDNTFLDVNYGNHSGNLYEQHSPGSGGYDLAWLGSDPAAYTDHIQKVNNETANDWSDFLNFLQVLNENPAALNTVLDVPEFLTVFAFDQAIGNFDFYNTTGRNYALYRDAAGDGRFHWLPWDYNLTWNQTNLHLTVNPDETSLLVKTILTDTAWQRYYLEQLCTIKDYLAPAYLDPIITHDSAMIRPYLVNDSFSDYTVSQFDANFNSKVQSISGLKPYAAIARDAIDLALAHSDVSCGSSGTDEPNRTFIRIFPNPAQDIIHIVDAGGTLTGQGRFIIRNVLGAPMRADAWQGQTDVDVSGYAPGVYFLEWWGGGASGVVKFVVGVN